MTTIKARPANVRKHVKVSEKVTEKNFVLLHAYARSIGEDVPFVLDELIGTLEDDKDFKAWLKLRPENASWKPAIPESKTGRTGKKTSALWSVQAGAKQATA